jgi:small subunit ribosomal protein S6
MALYEHIFLCRQDVTSEQVAALAEQFSNVITNNGGAIKKSEYWGVKTLTFRIRKNRKAHFSLLNIDAPAAAIAEMERQMSINEDVVRHLTIRVEAHEDGPSAMLQKKERDEKIERAYEVPDNFEQVAERKGGGRFRAAGSDIEA